MGDTAEINSCFSGNLLGATIDQIVTVISSRFYENEPARAVIFEYRQ